MIDKFLRSAWYKKKKKCTVKFIENNKLSLTKK